MIAPRDSGPRYQRAAEVLGRVLPSRIAQDRRARVGDQGHRLPCACPNAVIDMQQQERSAASLRQDADLGAGSLQGCGMEPWKQLFCYLRGGWSRR
jgi:hypothetical protein